MIMCLSFLYRHFHCILWGLLVPVQMFVKRQIKWFDLAHERFDVWINLILLFKFGSIQLLQLMSYSKKMANVQYAFVYIISMYFLFTSSTVMLPVMCSQPANLERKEMSYSCFCETGHCCILCSHSSSNRCSIIEKKWKCPRLGYGKLWGIL